MPRYTQLRLPVFLLAFFLVMASFAAARQPSGALRITRGLAPYQVLQRDRNNEAEVSFFCTVLGLDRGILHARVLKQDGGEEVLPRHHCGDGKWNYFDGHLRLPTGGPYEIQLECWAEGGRPELLARTCIRNVLVGDLWILAGQSNMEGCGILKRGAVKPHPRVHVFDMADRWQVAEEPLHWKHESVDEVHSGPSGEELEKRRRQARKHRWRGAGLGKNR